MSTTDGPIETWDIGKDFRLASALAAQISDEFGQGDLLFREQQAIIESLKNYQISSKISLGRHPSPLKLTEQVVIADDVTIPLGEIKKIKERMQQFIEGAKAALAGPTQKTLQEAISKKSDEELAPALKQQLLGLLKTPLNYDELKDLEYIANNLAPYIEVSPKDDGRQVRERLQTIVAFHTAITNKNEEQYSKLLKSLTVITVKIVAPVFKILADQYFAQIESRAQAHTIQESYSAMVQEQMFLRWIQELLHEISTTSEHFDKAEGGSDIKKISDIIVQYSKKSTPEYAYVNVINVLPPWLRDDNLFKIPIQRLPNFAMHDVLCRVEQATRQEIFELLSRQPQAGTSAAETTPPAKTAKQLLANKDLMQPHVDNPTTDGKFIASLGEILLNQYAQAIKGGITQNHLQNLTDALERYFSIQPRPGGINFGKRLLESRFFAKLQEQMTQVKTTSQAAYDQILEMMPTKLRYKFSPPESFSSKTGYRDWQPVLTFFPPSDNYAESIAHLWKLSKQSNKRLIDVLEEELKPKAEDQLPTLKYKTGLADAILRNNNFMEKILIEQGNDLVSIPKLFAILIELSTGVLQSADNLPKAGAEECWQNLHKAFDRFFSPSRRFHGKNIGLKIEKDALLAEAIQRLISDKKYERSRFLITDVVGKYPRMEGKLNPQIQSSPAKRIP
jgi:hypothetical protein